MIYLLYRWWGRYRNSLMLLLLGGGAAWFFRLTNGAILSELYQILNLPFQEHGEQQQLLLQAQTWELEQRLKDLEAQNQQLESLLQQPTISQHQSIASKILARSADNWWEQLTLAKGSSEGVRPGSIVSAPGGLVGRVTNVTPHTSRVLLITDPSSRIGVIAGRTREMGILRGQGDGLAVLEFFEKDPKVRPGDPVLTSQLSSLFPAKLPIGEIKSVEISDTANPRAIVQLATPLNNLEWVIVSLDVRNSQAVASPGS